MPIEDIFLHPGPRHSGDGPHREGHLQGWRGNGNRGLPRHAQNGGNGAWKCSRSFWTKARAGDNVGLLLRGIEKDDVERGQVVAKPGSIKPAQEVQG